MKHALIRRLHKNFEDYVHLQYGVEFWFARDLQNLLGYTEWRNFLKVIEKARESCKNANNPVLDHFVDANKSIPVPALSLSFPPTRQPIARQMSAGFHK